MLRRHAAGATPDRLAVAVVSAAVIVAVIVAILVGVAGAATGEGMLRPADVGLERRSAPHRSTVVAIDLVQTGSCEHGEPEERTARVQSFVESSHDTSTGAALNQIVFDFPSVGAAKSFFAEVRTNERRRAECGTTVKATDLSYSTAPAGVGDQRFTVAANETIDGEVREVRAVHLLDGTHVHKLVFIDWESSLAPSTAVSRRAVQRLG